MEGHGHGPVFGIHCKKLVSISVDHFDAWEVEMHCLDRF